MENSRLLELLRSFTPVELTAFGKFLRSPFFNHREDIIRLFDYFFAKRVARQTRVFEKGKVFQAIFFEEDFDEKKLNHTLSFLFQAAQGFLVFKDVMATGNESEFYLRLARILRTRGLERQSKTALQKGEMALTNQPYRNNEYHRRAYLLHLERYESEARQQRAAARSFQEMAGESDLHFMAGKLRQGCMAHLYKAVSKANYRLDLLDEVLELVAIRQLQTLPAIGIYYFAYRALTETASHPWYAQLREVMSAHFQQFPKEEMRDIYTLAVNYCIRQSNTRQGAETPEFYLRQLFGLYEEGLQNGVFLEDGVLSRFTYKNIAHAGLGLNAFEWVENFLNEYKDALLPKHKESAYCYNLASLHFRRSNYGEVLQLLTQTEFDDVLHQLDARRMLLRSYYELGEFSALDSLLDSFESFLRRRRDVGYLRENYLQLIRLTKKRLQISASDLEARERLRAEVLGLKALAERAWLLTKV